MAEPEEITPEELQRILAEGKREVTINGKPAKPKKPALPQDYYSRKLEWQLRQYGITNVKSEHPWGQWVVDVFLPDLPLVVEVEGGIWMRNGGAHNRPANIMRDIAKGNALMQAHIWLLRVLPREVDDESAVQKILLALNNKPQPEPPKPQPRPRRTRAKKQTKG